MDHPEFTGARRLVKEAFDRVLASTAVLLLAPLFVSVTAAIRLGDRGPALFRQTGVGKDGRPFAVYKFRTIVVDAEARKAELVLLNETGDVQFKMRKDPRITRVGELLRRWSLDELPQLFNVIRGDMSLVGPRPPLPDEVAKYPTKSSADSRSSPASPGCGR